MNIVVCKTTCFYDHGSPLKKPLSQICVSSDGVSYLQTQEPSSHLENTFYKTVAFTNNGSLCTIMESYSQCIP